MRFFGGWIELMDNANDLCVVKSYLSIFFYRCGNGRKSMGNFN